MILEKENRDTTERSESLTSNNNQYLNTSPSPEPEKLFNKKQIYSVIQGDEGKLLILIFLKLKFAQY
jgi:hypothetical protein